MIVFFHGFGATGQGSAKAALLRQHFQGRADVVTPTYPCADPDSTFSLLSRTVRDHARSGQPLLIGGISFGGFWARRIAQDFPGAGLLMINPALDGAATLARYQGVNTNYDSGETFQVGPQAVDRAVIHNVAEDRSGLPTLLLLASDDDVVPPAAAQAVYDGRPNSRVVVLDQCGHRFSRFGEVLDDITAFYDSLPSWGEGA